MRLGVYGPTRLHLDAHREARRNGWSVVPLRGPDVAAEIKHLQVDAVLGADAPGLGGDHDRPDERVVLQTSGSTGEPKPVVLTETMLQAHRDACATRIGHGHDSHWLLSLPLTHMGGVALLDRCLRDEARLTVVDPFDAKRVAAALHRVTHVSVVPAQLRRILAVQPTPPPGLRCVLLGGDGVDETLVQDALADGWPIYCSYGMTETCGQVATATPQQRRQRPGTVGRPLPGIDVSLDADGQIIVLGATVAGDGPHATGDYGRIDNEGFLYVTGRVAERIVTGGKTVDARAVETVLLAHPAIRDCVVVGIANADWGQMVAARIDAANDVADAELVTWCRERVEPAAVPRIWSHGDTRRDAQGKAPRAYWSDALTPR